jgi:hypothetical protein
MKRTIVILGAAAAVTLGMSTTGGPVVAAGTPTWTFQPVITHLNEPRGLSFDGGGNLYVAEAGKPGSGTAGMTRTGAVDRFRWAGGALAAVWSTHFTSIFSPGEGGGTDVLGPAAVTATGASCLRHHGEGRAMRGEHGGCQVEAILSESHRGIKATTGLSVPQIGHLYALNRSTGKARSLSDVGDQNYAWTADHVNLFPDDFPDSNPYAVLRIRNNDRDHGRSGHRHHASSRTFVADAGANTISEIMRNGRSRVIAYIPNETSGAMRDATPTCIAEGPDGALYVGALDLVSNFAAGSGQSNVWRVDPNSTNWRHNASLWATGYTTINGCTFDRHNNFWASELFYPNAAGPPGDLAMAPFRHPSAITHVGGGALPLPGGIDQGPDGAMYVSVGAADPTPQSGAVVRVAGR